jgi:WD40 repeat protein
MKTNTALLLIWVWSVLSTHAQNSPDILWQDATTYGYTATSVAVSPDGRYAASPGNAGVQIWSATNGVKVTSLSHGYWVANLAFSPDGNYLVAGGGTPPLSVWRVSDWSLAYTLSDVSPGPAAFSPDSSVLAVASNTVIQLRRATNGALLTSWTYPPIALGGINTLAFSPDGTKLASGAGLRSSDLTLKIWSVPSGGLLLNIPTAQTYTVGFATFSPDGLLIATAGGRYAYGPAQLWRVADGSLVRTFPEDSFTVAFSPDGALAVVAGTELAIYSVAGGSLICHSSDNGSHYQRAVATTPDGRTFLHTRFPGAIYAASLPLWINSFTHAGDHCLFSWTGGGGHYQLQQCTNMLTSTWQNVGGVLTNRAAEIPLQFHSAFYRVIALPE